MAMLPPASKHPLVWDIFCHVIDNWGDLGVCWRLASQLAEQGQQVRLWTDDSSPLAWMAPGAVQGLCPGISVHPWPRINPAAQPPDLPAGDVLIEAFGCDIPPSWVEQLHAESLPGQSRRLWLNLEYLSAESYVERCHGLPSPVMSGPLTGRTKWFFYPGFTSSTGGLLREPDLASRIAGFDRAAWRRQYIADRSGDPLISVFCYEPPALSDLIRQPVLAHAQWLVAPGRPHAAMVQAWPQNRPTAHCQPLPYQPQSKFDELLWACDLNLVRGEDSLVRALWAGQAFVWHIYPQDDNAHHDKLEAFLDWLDAPPSLRAFHHVWNGLDHASLPPVNLSEWQDCALAARTRLLAQDDLLTQLFRFVAEKR